MQIAADILNPTLKGAEYRSTHKLAVIGVLGDRAPKVSSRGSRFYNIDRWTVRVFTREMCKWAQGNPQCIPTIKEIGEWVRTANSETVPMREIVIANTPAKLRLRTALALTGGAYHEAFHTYYSCLRPLTAAEMAELVIPRWARVPDWSRYYKLLQDWSNIIEDIRIERLGRVEFEGSVTKLHDLQDFILAQEAKGLANARAHGGANVKRNALSVVTATFRDVGLGYNTDTQQETLAGYRAENPEAVLLVLGAGKGNPGPLTGLLKETIALPETDDTGCIRVAMDVIGVLYEESSEEDPANDPDNEEHQPGEPQKTACPKCGAKGSKLVIRPKSNGRGGKDPLKGILTCSVCGFQTEVDLKPKQQGVLQAPPQAPPQDTPKFEGFDKDEDKSQCGGGSAGEGEESDDSDDSDDASGQGKQGDDSEGDDSEGDDSEGDDSEGDDSSGGGSEGDPSDEDSDDGSGGGSGESDEDGDESDEDGKGSGDKSDEDEEGDEGDEDDGAGGEGDEDDDTHEGNDWSDDDDLTGDGDEDADDGELGDLDEGGTVGAVADNESHTDADGDENNDGAPGGGHNYEAPEIEGNDWSKLVDEALEGAEDENGLRDNNSALEEAVGDEAEDEERGEGGVKVGERPWRPYDPAQDEFLLVGPSRGGKDHDRDLATRLYASVKDEASFLRSRLRTIVKALEMNTVIHGTRRGRRLSGRFLVDSRNTLKGGQQPKRAYTQIDEAIDTSLSAAIVLDQSGSMSGSLKDVTRILCAITEPLDALGCPVQVSGFRDGQRWSDPGTEGRDGYHRFNAIVHDIFKRFDEPLRSVKWRFANTRATGGTPMADGVQFGLDSLSARTEGHRILFVITDGQPNGGHAQIIARQCRLAKAAGVHVIGVGLGNGARYVTGVFPDSVWTPRISDMPKALIAKLNELIDVKASKRGKRIANTG